MWERIFHRATHAAGKSGRMTGSIYPGRFPSCIRPDFPAAFVARWKMRSHKNHQGGRGLMVPGFALALSRARAALFSGSGAQIRLLALLALAKMAKRVMQTVAGPCRPYALSNPRPTVFVGTHFPSCYKCSWEIGPDIRNTLETH